jgi:hypothetical protein
MIMHELILQSMLGQTALTIPTPFDYADVALSVATVAAAVLVLTFGYSIAFGMVKKVIGRLSGKA